MNRKLIQKAVNDWYERTDDIPLGAMTTELDDLVDTLVDAVDANLKTDNRSTTITYKDTRVDCVYEYEPSDIGGDVGEVLPAGVYIEAVTVGGVDISGLLDDQIEQLESHVLQLHELQLQEQRADAEVDAWLASQGAYAYG